MSQLSTGTSRAEKKSLSSKSIQTFCDDHDLSRSFYYKLRAQGLGPREMHINNLVRITSAAEAEWMAAREGRTTD